MSRKDKTVSLRKSASCQMYVQLHSSHSESSTSTTSSENSDTPLRRFNRLVRSSVARHWSYFKKNQPGLRPGGHSVSETGLCSIVDNDPELAYLDIPAASHRRSLQPYGTNSTQIPICTLHITSAGGSSSAVGPEEVSDGSDAERPRKTHHLRVPTPAYPGQIWLNHMENTDSIPSLKTVRWYLRRDSLPLATIRRAIIKTGRGISPDNLLWRRRSTGNFAAGAVGGGCGVPRSAPATPLQLEPNPPRTSKHDKQAIKPLSGSAPSVRVSNLSASGTSDTAETKDGKQPSKARQKKFQRHFPQVGPEEKVLNYYSCALVGDLLLQGHLYITKNYFAFYSNVFGYVTKLLIPTASVLRITKEKVARIIPNAVGVCTRDERHVFGSLLSRDSTYKLMTHVWKSTRGPELATPKAPDVPASEVEVSEYSPEDDSSSAGGDRADAPTPPVRRESEAIISAGGAAVIQPALLTGGTGSTAVGTTRGRSLWWSAFIIATAILTLSASLLAYRLYQATYHSQVEEAAKLSGEELYSELVRWRARLHGRAANELHAFLTTNLLLLTKVRQSLEALSGVILTDMAQSGVVDMNFDVPNDTVFS